MWALFGNASGGSRRAGFMPGGVLDIRPAPSPLWKLNDPRVEKKLRPHFLCGSEGDPASHLLPFVKWVLGFSVKQG